MKNIKAIFLDLGDVIMEEATEVKDENGVTLSAELIPGAKEAVKQIKEMGYTLALVADTYVGTYNNVLKAHDLFAYFDAFAISDEVGCLKPDPRMFKKALDDLEITEADYNRVIMVGNNLERDIAGANRVGLITVWSNWNDNDGYKEKPEKELEFPDYEIGILTEIIALLPEIEESLDHEK
ncbi:putative hydrolase of the HAD superfamily [Halanaerobium saccharolyticum]|uniref:Putative hydrolase of the HAD superfamily n=1 Tax=Halanaerobium saccharolyticum TaxID=43595 RepID=A0A4R7Z533_9FIRM|nr:HAD-IIIA family hydrolase [Halanaerobium saccharolyticum]RAK07840.1 putative hydrolase of the HAD superfamily [Halanaerobium saccharolyticum]TDW04454.1 putative hydrolase of the HAD superfamily [Halanaerobium saccharolyticum]TDX59790.1 putative hydrolase of the HAD superfamily [Halanaerobium saccharolyticum]